jgi:hypothetical protein
MGRPGGAPYRETRPPGCTGTSHATSPRELPIPKAVGFLGDNTASPLPGSWLAVRRTISTVGYANDRVGEGDTNIWLIWKQCRPIAGCSLFLRKPVENEPPIEALLTPARDGWHATFPRRFEVCGHHGAETIYWPQHVSMVFRFIDGGRRKDLHERLYSYTPECGYGTSSRTGTLRFLVTPQR